MRPHARLSDDGAPLHRRTSGEDDLADWLKKELMTHEIFRKFRFNSSGMLGINNNSNPIESHHRFLTTPNGPLRARASREFLFYSGYRKLTGEDATKASKLLRDDAEKAGNHVTGEWPARDRLGFIVVPEQYVAKAASFMNADICWSDRLKRSTSIVRGTWAKSRSTRNLSQSTTVASPDPQQRASRSMTAR